MRQPKKKWVEALRALTGQESDDIRYNEDVSRWEFVLMSGDGIPRSQFWGRFDLPVDPVSGLHPYRSLDDASMLEALHNLQKTFVGNPYDGAGSTFKEVSKRLKWNKDESRKRYLQSGMDFADMAAERGHRLRGATMVGYGGTVAQAASRIEIPSVIGGRKTA